MFIDIIVVIVVAIIMITVCVCVRMHAGKQRVFELQFQGYFKKKIPDNMMVWFGGEVMKPIRLGRWRALMQLSRFAMDPVMRWCYRFMIAAKLSVGAAEQCDLLVLLSPLSFVSLVSSVSHFPRAVSLTSVWVVVMAHHHVA